MAKYCCRCGKQINFKKEKDKFNDWCEEKGWEEKYDDFFNDGEIFCSECAINDTLENLGAGLAMDYSLVTGDSPDNCPDDWEMHDSDEYI